MIENLDLYEYLSGYKNLEMLAEMSVGIGRDDIWSAMEIVGMEYRIYDKVRAGSYEVLFVIMFVFIYCEDVDFRIGALRRIIRSVATELFACRENLSCN